MGSLSLQSSCKTRIQRQNRHIAKKRDGIIVYPTTYSPVNPSTTLILLCNCLRSDTFHHTCQLSQHLSTHTYHDYHQSDLLNPCIALSASLPPNSPHPTHTHVSRISNIQLFEHLNDVLIARKQKPIDSTRAEGPPWARA